MIQFLLIICVASLTSDYARAQAPVCQYTPVDGGDPESVQKAQLDAIKCLIETNRMLSKDSVDAIKTMHNDSVNLQQMILKAIKSGPSTSYSVGNIIGYTLTSILITFIFYQFCKISWYLLVQRFDNIANLLLGFHNLRARWWNSAIPSLNTLEELRQSQPVPPLLVVIYCCRCKTSDIDV